MWDWPADDDGPRDLLAPAGGPVATAALYVSLRRSARWDVERLRRWQADRLSRVVGHARRHVPLYRDRLGDASTAFEDLPTIDSGAYRLADRDAMLSGPVPPGSQRILTSGSTGQVVEIFYPPNHRRALGALKMRMDAARGIRPTTSRLTVSVGGAGGRRGAWSFVARRHDHIDALAPPDAVAARIAATRAAVVTGYANVLVDAAESAASAGRPLPRAQVTTYGLHLDATTRAALERLYGTRPLDTYGANEHGAIAWQCRHADLYHLNHESVFVELVDDDDRPVPHGTPGNVVVTSLANPLMPFVRHRVGDVATLATRPCACGYALAALASIGGQALEWFHLPEGRRLAPERLWMDLLVDPRAMRPHVRKYQVRQLADGSVRVAIATFGDPLPSVFADEVAAAYRALLGPDVPVRVEHVDDIAREPSGKFRVVASDHRG